MSTSPNCTPNARIVELCKTITQFGRYQHMRGRTAGTQRSYGYLLEQYGRWLEEQDTSWKDASGDLIELFLEEYRATHSRSSTALFSTCLKSFYRWARRKGLITVNPTDELDEIQRDRPAPRPISDTQTRELLTALDTLSGSEGRRNRMIVRTFLYTGLRLAELAGLDRSDIDMDAKTITVRYAKGGRQRIVAMPDVLHQDFVDWGLPEEGPIWRCSRGRLSAAGISEMFRDVVRDQLGLKGITAHVLRHTHATKVRRSGGDLRGIQVQLGHASPNTTAMYTAVYDDELHQAVNRLTAGW